MLLAGNCQTTAMGIMPHEDIDEALALAFSLDIPFWPQLPRVSFFEDMYVQASEHFPGMRPDAATRSLHFSLEDFYLELEAYAAHMEDPAYFRLSPDYSAVYDRFLSLDLSHYAAVRGQIIGPVSFGLKITDENRVPIIYHDEVRELLFDFLARKVRVQVEDLRQKNASAFVWVDEPGLELVFTAVTGYAAERAREDYRRFLADLPRPRSVHLCGNPDWSFLLDLDLDILSVDALQWGYIFSRYAENRRRFLDRGGIISWGITPTLTEEMEALGSAAALVARLEEMWDYLANRGINKERIVRQAWLALARCCLINADGGATVARSFALVREIARILREKYRL
ncbi:MAG: hypothetical protein ACUVTQ_08580 [Desulfotomaculales bacterium]